MSVPIDKTVSIITRVVTIQAKFSRVPLCVPEISDGCPRRRARGLRQDGVSQLPRGIPFTGFIFLCVDLTS